LRCQFGDVEDDSTSVALGCQKAAEAGMSTNTKRLNAFGRLSDCHRLELHGDLAGAACFLHRGIMLEHDVQGRQSGGRVSE